MIIRYYKVVSDKDYSKVIVTISSVRNHSHDFSIYKFIGINNYSDLNSRFFNLNSLNSLSIDDKDNFANF